MQMQIQIAIDMIYLEVFHCFFLPSGLLANLNLQRITFRHFGLHNAWNTSCLVLANTLARSHARNARKYAILQKGDEKKTSGKILALHKNAGTLHSATTSNVNFDDKFYSILEFKINTKLEICSF